MTVMPAVLMELMRHSSSSTTMRYYATKNAEPTAELLWDEKLMLAHGLERPHILRHRHPH